MNMKKIHLIIYMICLSISLQARDGISHETLCKDAPLIVADSFENKALSAGSSACDTLSCDTLACDTLACDTIASTLTWPQNVVARINRLLDNPLLQRTQLGLMVYDLTADSVIFQTGERQTLRPASVMKLVTAITALDRLGSNYQFRTSLYYTGQVKDSVLRGDIYCVGGMDPRFNHDDMNAFAESIRRMGVDSIQGRIIADTSMKDETRLGEGWCWDDENPVLTPLLTSQEDDFMNMFVESLNSKGIDTSGATVEEGTLPSGAYALCSRFHSLDQILMRMIKESDNLYAESMYYQIAALGGTKRASADNARTQERKLISKIGLKPANYKLADGSGLSLYNYVTVELIVKLLRYAYQNANIFDSLYPALPIAGTDGTLAKRMKGPFTNGNVRAKTGTLTGISSLAGYCVSANNHLLAFCIINQGVLRNSAGRNFQDRVCIALCEP